MNIILGILASSSPDGVAFGDAIPLPVIAIIAGTPAALPDKIVWMPAGRHALTAHTLNGPGFSGEIICDEQACRAVQSSFEAMQKAGQRAWIDADHDDGAALGWVKGFTWDPAQGIMASVDWTSLGATAIRDKQFFSFSPAFNAEAKTGRVVGLIRGHAAGGLVNAPAFGSAMPALIAARLGSVPTTKTAPGGNPENTNMKDLMIKLLAALKVPAPADATEEILMGLYAKHYTDIAASSDAAVVEVRAALKVLTDKVEADKKVAEEAAIQAKAKKDAEIAEIQAKEKKDAEIAAVMAAFRAGADGRAGVVVTDQTIESVLRGFAKCVDPRARGLFFRDSVKPIIAKHGTHAFSQTLAPALRVLAKDVSIQANALGTLVGNLIAQQSLALLKYKFPILKSITTDFSNLSADFGQTIITRLKVAIVASQYTGAGYAAAAASTTDVPLTLSHHPYAQVQFNANELASTNRDLFGEQAEVVNYAIGLDIVNALYALLTQANFTTAALVLGGTGGGTANASGTGYARQSAIYAAKALFNNKQPEDNRVNLLNADAFGALAADPAVVSLAAFQKSDIIEGYGLPPIAGMNSLQIVNLPTTGNMVGFAMNPRALVLATRVPNDYTQALPGSNYGNVSQVEDPDTGISLMLTQYVNHDSGTANYRAALMYGVAVGDPLAGVIVAHS